ncbi:type I DNA topoisomerase [Deinococcus radiopugnans]|uniref:DNA topoisomerase 1 n=1 Tax=Deinococcus radiopugnans ATCC 19172 TaxID=585398 RepID=A0A5C4Y6B2_9DEIO|nr:type I DNA topoisomerase [Deinococcus radiopugnans]MBB6016738.1 DNA topoisomerase-1 [Deinococcus radiopugnans ATCC 19172]TNM70844.1 type I DNA topoisomerase [Deinococcus radiopugnans ATCC 19172]
MSKTLVIVESPAKARTIEKYLGKGYAVESSIGHIRDLPKSAADIPEKYKGLAWARLGLDIENDFQPLYVVSPEKRQHVAKLRKMAADADEIILATDDDREGESIAWHLFQELKPKVPVKRMVFHEITREAIQAAIASPRQIDTNLVEAQEARRALDRLYGYEVSPVLWKKVAPKLSAGRVQSVATRMLVERERERMRFVSAMWWDLLVTGRTAEAATFPARLTDVAGQKLAVGKDFDALTGKLKPDAKVRTLSEAEARALAAGLTGQPLTVTSAEEKPFTQRPYPPFITSTLQQEGSRKLGFAATRTMRAAQRLYEGGYITYMRTDSTNLSAEAVTAARKQVSQMYGQPYLSPQPRVYAKKAKNAQEAHEAIRPAGSSFRTPDSLRGELGGDEWRLYDLIWKRTVACQMADARGRSLRVRLGGKAKTGEDVGLSASGRTIDFPGFLRAYVEGSDDPSAALEDRETPLPPLKQGQRVTAETVKPEGHETQPPARYTEASLVQSLEGAGIGRPSTYASILGTIQDRGYATKKGQALVPSWTAFATSALLEHHFGTLVDYDFTAKMEEDLDDIAGGRAQRVPYLKRFYLGVGGEGMALRPLIDRQMGEIDARGIATIAVPRLVDSGIEVRVGRYGPYMQRGEDKANLPEGLAPDELTLEKAEEIMSRPSGDRPLGIDEASGHPVVARAGRYGPYVTLGAENPPIRTASLFPTDDLDTLTLPRALKLLSLPRLVGTSEGEEVWALNGKYGPYLKRGSDSRSLTAHEELFTVTLPEAEALFLQPRFAKGRTPTPPLSTYKYEGRADIVLKSGRFGPYLTDGERNATLRKGESEDNLTAERALEILEERGKEPKAKAGKPRKAAAKTGAAKKPAARSAAPKKAPAKKAATKAPAVKTTKKAPAKAPAKPTFTWAQLKPHLKVLSAQEQQLVTATREQGRKVDDVAPELGLDVKKAKGMALQASKKLNQAARGE